MFYLTMELFYLTLLLFNYSYVESDIGLRTLGLKRNLLLPLRGLLFRIKNKKSFIQWLFNDTPAQK